MSFAKRGAASAVVTILEKVTGACHIFLPGTGVLLADGTREAIEDVEAGDTVTTTDATTGKSIKKKVISTITTEDDKEFTEIAIATGDMLSSIIATDTHSFWVPELKQWIRAGDLQVGQWLRTSAATHVQITAPSHYIKRQRTHDLTMALKVESSAILFFGFRPDRPNFEGRCLPPTRLRTRVY
ncbi:Hint domain-containing protein [Streptomyces sp. BE133]|uniref:Hint domain-containing protein n=1 Tax=Streptomyces sp. BE133 TaxID=3002523 RepID=UPI002E781E48|nr:Hint domain-containing protein [Streptomyces sp. BE133]MEE1807257.1 polymorphic toxin-type HINT domain-containing protein [Streptomyces sp. BE133]